MLKSFSIEEFQYQGPNLCKVIHLKEFILPSIIKLIFTTIFHHKRKTIYLFVPLLLNKWCPILSPILWA